MLGRTISHYQILEKLGKEQRRRAAGVLRECFAAPQAMFSKRVIVADALQRQAGL